MDTLSDLTLTRRFGESFGSYPVLRLIDLGGRDRAPRLDGNRVAGRIQVEQILEQLAGASKIKRAQSR
ncbi:MAG: hypothetical protein U0931_11310 [Vulcanimicrobiota bacterium]